jgi:hypothetical protein
MAPARSRFLLLGVVSLVLLAAPGTARSTKTAPFPAAGELTVPRVVVRARPHPRGRIIRRLTQLRPDYRVRVVLALGTGRSADGASWYRLSLPGRPNGLRGWVPADDIDVHPVPNRITIFRGARRLEVRRRVDRQLLLRTTIAVGKPGAETPFGRNFYVQWRFVPRDAFYGTFALETSAYAPVSDWPGGGLVGIHGTNAPHLLGQAVSHGCVRLPNAQASKLRRLAPLGTPVDIVA